MTIKFALHVKTASLVLGLVASPAMATVYSGTSALDFSTAGESMWGANGPDRVDTGTLFLGPQWNVSATQTVSQDYRYTIPLIERSTSQSNLNIILGSQGKIGFDFRAILDPGSVDANYSGSAQINVSDGGRQDGTRRFVIDSAAAAPSTAQLKTFSPQIDIESNFITDYKATLSASGRAITQPNKQVYTTIGCLQDSPLGCVIPKLGWKTTVSEETASIPSQTLTLFDVKDTFQLLKVTNQEITVAGFEIAAADTDGQLALNFDIGFDPLEYLAGREGVDVRIVEEGGDGRPRKSKNLDPTDIVSASFSMGDVTAYVPLLNTDSGGVDGATTIHTSGSTRLAKLDVDGDFIVTTQTGIPFGATLGVGPFEVSADLIDADLGNVFLADQNFGFDSYVEVTYGASKSVRFRALDDQGNPIGDWTEGQQFTVKLGTKVEIESVDGAAVDVTPTYRLRNTFTNQTRLLAGLEYDVAFLQASTSGPASEFIDYPAVAPAKRFTDFLLDPAPLATLFNDSFELDGFNTIQGETFTLAGATPPPDYVVELITGSPAELAQTVDNPGAGISFELAFDYWFVTGGGTLEVFLGDDLLTTLFGAPGQTGFVSFVDQFLVGALVTDPLLELVFRFDAANPGEVLRLDNIGFPGLANGDFADGSLDGWTARTSGGATIAVAAIPAPGGITLLAAALVAFATARLGRRRPRDA
jgi:hypothetical protein